MLIPRIASILLAAAPIPRIAPARLALLQLRGAPGQAGVSLVAIVASVSLLVSMAIMVASFRTSLDAWLERVLPADVYLRANAVGDSAYLTADDQTRIAALPGVRRVEFIREQQLLLDPNRPRVVLLVREGDASALARQLPLVGGPVLVATGAPPPIWVNEAMVDLYGFALGQDDRASARRQSRHLHRRGRVARLRALAGRPRDRARPLHRPHRRSHRNQRRALARPGRHSREPWRCGRSRYSRWFAAGHRRPGEIRDLSLKAFDRTFAITYALELAAVVIGLFGLSSSFGALVLARRREFGLLRHLGMTRRQVGAMLAVEGLVVSGIGLGHRLSVSAG